MLACQHESTDLHQLKYVEKLLLFVRLVFSRTLCQPVYKFPTSSFDKLSFFPRRKSIFKFCVYKLVEAVRYLKFKWQFVIIGRGCLVLLKFKSSCVGGRCVLKLCKGYVPLVLNLLVLIRHPCVLIVSE